MKKLVMMLMMLAGLTLGAKAQVIGINELPVGVKGTFSQQFGTATDISWTQSGADYGSTFKVDGVRHSVTFDSEGKINRHSQDLTQTDLPGSIVTSLERDYKSTQIDQIEKIDEGGRVTYKIKGKPDYNLTFDAQGNVIQ